MPNYEDFKRYGELEKQRKQEREAGAGSYGEGGKKKSLKDKLFGKGKP